MAKAYQSDTQISMPTSKKFPLHANLNGFGWNNDEGMFIPVDDTDTLFQSPYSKIIPPRKIR
jgi:hypothetical protein